MRGRMAIAGQAQGLRGADRQTPQLRTVVVVSGKGGVGKTTLSANMALAVADRGHQTLLMDGDLTMANASVVLGKVPEYGVEDVLSGRCTPRQAVVEVEAGCVLLSAGSHRMQFAQNPGRAVGRLLHHFRDWGQRTELLIVDAAPGAAEDVVCWTLAADELILVLTPEPTSLTDAYILCTVLADAGFSGQLGLVVNMAGSLEARQVSERFTRAVGSCFKKEPVYLGNVPVDPEVSRAVKAHRPILRAGPNSPASRAIAELAANVLAWAPARTYSSLAEVFGTWARRLMRWQVRA